MRKFNPTIPSNNHNPQITKDEDEIKEIISVFKNNDYNSIISFISSKKILLNIKTKEEGTTPTHAVLENDNINENKKVQIIELLYDSNSSINSYNIYNQTPLHLASKYQYYEVVKYLLSKGAEINISDNFGFFPIHYASIGMESECNGKIENKNDNQIKSSLNKKFYNHIRKLTAELVTLFKKSGEYQPYFVDIKLVKKNIKIINTNKQNILDKIIDSINKNDKTDIDSSIYTSILKIKNDIKNVINELEITFINDPDKNIFDNYFEKILKIIVDETVDNFIIYSCYFNNNEKIKDFSYKLSSLFNNIVNKTISGDIVNIDKIYMGKNIDKKCYEFDLRIVEELINNGANVNSLDLTGETPIFHAISSSNKKLIDLLIKYNASVTKIKNNNGLNAIEYANSLYNKIDSSQCETTDMNIIIKNLTEPFTKNFLEKYKIVEHNDIIFPQTILMYNHLFYYYASKGFNEWKLEDYESLKRNIGISDNIFDSFLFLNNIEENLSNEELIKLNNTLDKNNKKIEKNMNIIEKFEQKIKQQEEISKDDKKFKRIININNLKESKKYFEEKIKDIQKDNENINNLIVNEKEKLLDIYNKTKNNINLENTIPHIFYKNILKDVAQENIDTYNNTWRSYIKNDSSNILNFYNFIKKKRCENVNITINNKDFYNKLLEPIIKSYNNDGIINSEVIKIIEHIVGTTICYSLYQAIIIIINSYFKLIGLDTNNIKYDILKNTILNDLSKNIVNIYFKDNIKSNSKVFGIVTNAIVKVENNDNEKILGENSSIIKEIEKYIYPHYEEMVEDILPSLKNMIDNFNKSITKDNSTNIIFSKLEEKKIEENKY